MFTSEDSAARRRVRTISCPWGEICSRTGSFRGRMIPIRRHLSTIVWNRKIRMNKNEQIYSATNSITIRSLGRSSWTNAFRLL